MLGGERRKVHVEEVGVAHLESRSAGQLLGEQLGEAVVLLDRDQTAHAPQQVQREAPVPGPISTAMSSALRCACSAIRRASSGRIRKFCPKRLRGLSPRDARASFKRESSDPSAAARSRTQLEARAGRPSPGRPKESGMERV